MKGGADGARPWELFDLDADPYEQDNLLEEANAESVAADLHRRLRDRAAETDDCIILLSVFEVEDLHEDWLDIAD